jgi:hypothetical protein
MTVRPYYLGNISFHAAVRIAQRLLDINVPADINRWSDRNQLAYLVKKRNYKIHDVIVAVNPIVQHMIDKGKEEFTFNKITYIVRDGHLATVMLKSNSGFVPYTGNVARVIFGVK